MTLRRLAAWFWGMAAILAMLLTIVDLQALDTGWYDDWYRHSDLAERLDVPEESLEEACMVHGIDCDDLVSKMNEVLATR